MGLRGFNPFDTEVGRVSGSAPGPPNPPPPVPSQRRGARAARPLRDAIRPRVEGAGSIDFHGPAATAGAAAAPAAAQPIRRTPHMDVPAKLLQPRDSFDVSVYVDQKAARAGEDTVDIVVPVAGTQVEVQLIVSEHFAVNGSAVTTMTITDEPRSDAERPFKVTVVPANELPTKVPPSLIAQFFYKGRPSGKVSRTVAIAGVSTATVVPAKERVEVQDGVAADLTVVVNRTLANDGRQFTCTVRSPLLEKYKEGISKPWNLPDTAKTIVLGMMARFTADAITSSMLLAELRGAGRDLYDVAPVIFRQALWDLIDSEHAIKTIAIVTEEPFIPWELMVPYRIKSGKREQRDALGTEFCIGRWPIPDGTSPAQQIPLRDSFVVAPVYVPPLAFAADEAKLVVDNFHGEMIAPADFDGIEQKLGSQGKTLVHFICHGEDEETQDFVQIIRLENGQNLNSSQIRGMTDVDRIFEEKHPFVFLNACEVGRTTPALVGVGGFAKSFVDLGASAVIAPLWSVKDNIAHAVAQEFYTRVKAQPNVPFAEILRDLRKKAYLAGQAEDTYAAYCFYGDPAACRSTAG